MTPSIREVIEATKLIREATDLIHQVCMDNLEGGLEIPMAMLDQALEYLEIPELEAANDEEI